MLPFGELLGGDFPLESEQLNSGANGLASRLYACLKGSTFQDRGVLRILGRDVEMAGIGADAAVNAGLEPEALSAPTSWHEAAHGAGDPGLGS